MNDFTRTEPSNLRVLQIIHGLGTGGAETWLISLLRHWKKQAESGGLVVETDILLTGGERVTYDDEAEALGARLHYCGSTRGNLPTFARFLRSLYKERRYDAVHSHCDYLSGWHFAMGIGSLPRVRVAHVHNPHIHITENYAVSPIRRLSTRLGKSLVGIFATEVCGTSAQILREYGFTPGQNRRPKVTVAHCGFEVSRFNGDREPDRSSVRTEFGWPEDARLILFAGRLDEANPLFPALRSGPTAVSGASRQKQIPSSRSHRCRAASPPRRRLAERTDCCGLLE